MVRSSKDNPFDVSVPPDLTGLEGSQSPFLKAATAQRITMFGSAIYQALLVHGLEMPRSMSGNENQFGEYSMDPTKRDYTAIVHKVIPKFPRMSGGNHNPKNYVILITPTGEVDYVEMSDYTKLYNGFGYMNKQNTFHLQACMSAGAPLDKDVKLQYPPSHRQGVYSLGVNANVCYLTDPQATEDSVKISESFAKKCTSTAIYTAKIILNENETPINIYGTEEEPKVMPDIGEHVRDDGVIMAIRKNTKENLHNLTPSAMRNVLFGDDQIIRTIPGARIIDVQTYFSTRAYKNSDRLGVMGQLLQYEDMHNNFYKAIIDVYEELVERGQYKASPKFADLVYDALCLYKHRKGKGKGIDISDKRKDIHNCVLFITYMYDRKCSIGSKIAGRIGDKGVVSTIVPDEELPIDEQGIRADMVISPESVCNRTNISQLYEQFYNRLGSLFTMRLRDGEYGEGLTAYNTIIEFLKDINKDYTRLLEKDIETDDDKLLFVQDVLDDGIYLIMPPFLKQVSPEQVQFLKNKWNYVKSRVTFGIRNKEGKIKYITSEKPAAIGYKYVYLLGKIPSMQIMSHELTHVNQVGVPVKLAKGPLRYQYTSGCTPVRFGEDEIRVLSIALSPESTARFLMSRSGSTYATNKYATTIMTSKQPSNISKINISLKEMIEKSNTIGLLYHEFGIVGFDITAAAKGRVK